MSARFVLIVLLTLGAAAADAAAPAGRDAWRSGAGERGWALHLDNDLFALTDRDRDYTAGVAFTLGGERASLHPLSLARPLRRVNEWSGLAGRLDAGEKAGEGLELGLLLFTPQDLADGAPRRDDRPYASLLYAASTTLTTDESRGIAYQSSLTLGLLGLPLAAQVHRAIHDVFGSAEPRGYEHQISAGGEPTGRYAVSRAKRLARAERGAVPYTLRFGLEGSVGYLTQGSAEIAIRAGRTRQPWWSSWPSVSGFSGHPRTSAGVRRPRGGGPEVTFEAGAKASLRLYNSFLQGQFRDSPVEFSSSQLNRLVLDAWAGVTVTLANELTIGYSVHRQTAEIRTGSAARGFTWASIDVGQRF